MMSRFTKPRDVVLHYRLRRASGSGPAIVFLNSLGTDFRIWQGVDALLPEVTTLMMDKRGHGLSDLAPVSLDLLAQDVADMMDELGLGKALLCGVSIGGMIAQLVATKRPDLVAGLVLSNTATRIGDAESWNTRIAAVRDRGIEPIADAILQRWFSERLRATMPADLAGYRNMLVRTDPKGYAATCAAIRNADLTDSARGIKVPTVCIAGSEDLATPPGLVAELARMIPGARLLEIAGVGHLPCIEAPGIVAEELSNLLAVPA